MTIFNRDEYAVATANWDNCIGNFLEIERLIPTNYIFTLSKEQIDWLKDKNDYKEFCTEIGIYNSQLVLILSPLDKKGQKAAVTEYPYSVLSELQGDLPLVETKEYTVIKNAVLSNDLRKIDDNADMYFPVANMPMMDQDKAVSAIESWRNEGMNWFYYECGDFKGARVFKKFYVPSENLTPPKEGLTSFVCSFGLKYSDIYQRMLVTLIFISFYEDLQNNGSVETISNTYDWSQPCPPICRI
ncbi:hypothetical protein SAMN05421664_2478 [Chryseobacterium soldanellicola]|uniref:Uncharacterized protein n=1 Tax=Chryseobacterium soldanellicola TaxID=311333 RepID=A0A1H1DIX9_9FLAO|nr:hypothetical protein [Chryseobacterium soldanellicola]SDQ75806.1 hypothetical protein SAMN05421664_2478 [Chryseobacterium soldanellicola]